MDKELLAEAIRLSSAFEREPGMTPFGALVSYNGTVVGRGLSSVVADKDPTAHAEINAIREAGTSLGSHNLQGATLYSSAFPCPLCLMACVWAGIETVYYGAELSDSLSGGFEDSKFYQALETGPQNLGVHLVGVGGQERAEATAIIRRWKRTFDTGNWD